MAGIDTATLARCADRARDAAVAMHDDLNAADAKIGDGDTGVMLRRLFETIANAVPRQEIDVGLVFQALAKACASATGSSLGTLVTVAMMTLAKATKGRTEVAWSELGPLLIAVRDQMMARGKAQLGDKTVVDILDAVARAIDGLDSVGAVEKAALEASSATLATFRMQPNRLGRARMFGDKTIGLDDPGMLAFSRLLSALAG